MTDTDICLALARARGFKAEAGERNAFIYPRGGRYSVRLFDPINNGADFDAVLMWARRFFDQDSWMALCEDMGRTARRLSDIEFRRAVCQEFVGAL